MAAWVPFWTVGQLEDTQTPLAVGYDLTLPTRPGYPNEVFLTQTVVGHYEDRRAAFQAFLDLSPDTVSIVMTAPSGPRILGLQWNDDGITEDRTPLAPEDLSGLNILGDIFLALWPADAVSAALPSGVVLDEQPGLRTVSIPDRVLVRITDRTDADGTRRQELENVSFGYRLSILTEAAN